MILKLANAMTLRFQQTLQDAARKDAIPHHFEIEPSEGYQLLRELNRCKDVRSCYAFEQEEGTHDIKLQLFGEPPTPDELTTIANDWYKGRLKINFTNGVAVDGTPIHIVTIKPKKKPQERRFRRLLIKKR